MSQDGFFQVVRSLERSPKVQSFPKVAAESADWNAAKEALDQPIDCPPLNENIFPGDRVAIVVQAQVPNQNNLLEVLVGKLIDSGCQPNELLVIQDPSQESFEQTASQNGWDLYCRPHFRESQDPADGCSMVGVSQGGDPIYINRHIAEADVVIPVVSFCNVGKGEVAPGYLYPDFSNTSAFDRIAKGLEENKGEVRQAESLINPFFVVAAGADSSTGEQQLFFGTRDGVESQANQTLGNSWEIDGRQDCQMVIATLQQVEEVEGYRRAIQSVQRAQQISQDLCPIMLVMKNRLGEPEIDPSSEGRPAPSTKEQFIQLIEQVTEERPVYLYGAMDQEETEDFGLGFIESENQILKMVERFSPAVCLQEAYRWTIKEQ